MGAGECGWFWVMRCEERCVALMSVTQRAIDVGKALGLVQVPQIESRLSADRRREPNFASPAARRGGPGEENLVDFSEIVPIDRSRRALFDGVPPSFFFAVEVFSPGGNVIVN